MYYEKMRWIAGTLRVWKCYLPYWCERAVKQRDDCIENYKQHYFSVAVIHVAYGWGRLLWRQTVWCIADYGVRLLARREISVEKINPILGCSTEREQGSLLWQGRVRNRGCTPFFKLLLNCHLTQIKMQISVSHSFFHEEVKRKRKRQHFLCFFKPAPK